MYRARGSSDVDFDAVTEIVARVQRLSRRFIVGSLFLGVVMGILAIMLTLNTYSGPGGKILGARLGFTFVAALAVSVGAGALLRKLSLRLLLPMWVKEMTALGVDEEPLREGIAPFID